MILDWILVRNAGVGFDFYTPSGVEEGGYDDHGGCGTDESEELAVDAAGGLPVIGVGEVHASAVDVLEGAACVLECGCDEGQALAGLFGDVGFIRAYGAGAGDVDVVADADGAGEADDGLEGRGAGDVGAFGHGRWIPEDSECCRNGAGVVVRLGDFVALYSNDNRECSVGVAYHRLNRKDLR